MSFQASNWASEQIITEAPCKSVLLVMAEAADKHGREARLSQWTLAVRTGLSDRTIRRALGKLEKDWGLVRRGDQSKVAHLPEDQRPIVWDLDLSKTGYFGVEEEELERKRQERNKRSNGRKKPKSTQVSATGTEVDAPQTAEHSGQTVRGTADTVSGGLRTESPGTTDTVTPRTVLEPSPEPSLEPHTAREPATADQTGSELCELLHGLVLQNWNGHGERPEITRTWQLYARQLLTVDNHSAADVRAVIEYSQAGWWSGRVKDMASLRRHYKTMRSQLDGNRKEASRTASSIPRKDDKTRRWAQGMSNPAAAGQLLGLTSRQPARQAIAAMPTVIELHQTEWNDVA